MSEVYLISSAVTGNENVHRHATVFHVDSDPAARDCVEQVAESMRLRYEGHRSSETYLDAFDGTRPGCLVLEVHLPHLSGLQVQAFLIRQSSPLPAIFISTDTTHETIVRAMKAGAFQFLRKPIDEASLWDTLQAAVHIDHRRRSRLAEQDKLRRSLELLDIKEQELLFLLLQLDSTKSIAVALNVTARTVELRRARIMQKLGFRSSRELFYFAFAVSQIIASPVDELANSGPSYPFQFPGVSPAMPSPAAGNPLASGS